MNNQKVVVITGPTGVGKTDLSLKLCEYFNGEIINADASQFKKELNIGTAKIDLSTTNIKHYLIDIINSDEVFSISDFQKQGRELITKIHEKNKIPFIVGGSGLYINSLLNDYDLNSPKRDDNLEHEYDDYSNEELHNILKQVDYQTSLALHPNNRRRVIRAIELAKSGKLISENNNGANALYNSLIICLNTDRETLYDRINKRVKMMINDGWIDECKKLIDDNVDVDKIKDIGYQEMFMYIRNEISYEDMIEIISKKTRNYAKRQLTWMRNKMNCIFIDIDYLNVQKTFEETKKLIDEYLQK